MANLTYGALSGSSADGSVILNPLGTDLIATSADGVEHAFAPGDIAWVLSAYRTPLSMRLPTGDTDPGLYG